MSDDKKTRGRPTSKKVIAAQQVKGIVNEPLSDKNIVELVSNQPQIFKKLPEILKAFKQIKIWIKLSPEGLEINFRDHLRRSYNRIFMPAAAMLRYYYDPKATEFWKPDHPKTHCIYLSSVCEHLSEVCKDVGDAFKELRIIVNKDRKWYLCIKDDNECTEVNEMPKPPTMPYCPVDGNIEHESEMFNYNTDNDYPIQFTISVDKLKTIVNRANNTDITFSKLADGKIIKIECLPKDGVPFWNVFGDPDKIALKMQCPEKDYIVVSVNSEYVKMAANTNIQFMKTVRVGLAAGKPLSLRWSTTDAENRETCVLHSYIDTR